MIKSIQNEFATDPLFSFKEIITDVRFASYSRVAGQILENIEYCYESILEQRELVEQKLRAKALSHSELIILKESTDLNKYDLSSLLSPQIIIFIDSYLS